MKPNPYVGRSLWAFDTETHLIQPGLLAPPLVCGSWARDPADTFGEPAEGILNRWSTIKDFRSALEGDMVIVGQNLAFDMGVMAAADPSLLPLIFAKYDRDQIFDTMIAEMLIQIHEGTLGSAEHHGHGGGHSLEDLGQHYLGVDMSADKAGPDAWRLRYAELDGVPLEQWPEAARAYPIRDARYTYDIAALQIKDGRNLHDLPAQCRAHFALHLASVWGVRTDAEWVAAFSEKVTKEHLRSRAHYLAKGLLKVNRCTKNQEPDAIDENALIASIGSPGAEMRAATLNKALADVHAGRRMRYGTDKKALEAAVTAAYEGKPPTSKKGNIKTNKDTLKESGDELLAEFAEAQDNEKYFSTYVKVLRQGAETPINCRYNVLVDTGRTSCSKPNLQNLPRGNKAGNPREGFVARPNTLWSSSDYPALELRCLAFALEYLGFKSEMAKALRVENPDGTVGIDLHAKLGAQIMGVSLETFNGMLESPDDAVKQKAKDFRQMAKAANFGLPGGLGAAKFVTYARDSYNARLCILSGRATTCGLQKHLDKRSKTYVCKACFQVAQALKDTWFAAWPEMEGYFDLVKEWTSRDTTTITNEDGELEDVNIGSVTQLLTERVRGRCTFTNGANTIFQGLGADIAKRALWLVTRECYTDPRSPLWGSRPVIFAHDEIIPEHPTERAAEAAERVARLMEQAFLEFCGPVPGARLGIPVTVEPALMPRWYKKAEAVYVNGRLVPWTPKPKAASADAVAVA